MISMTSLFVIAGRRPLGMRPALIRLAAALALAAFAAGPTQAAVHDMAMPMEAGHVHLQTSCAPAAADIDRGVSLLYAFWYDPARRSFQKAEAEQPPAPWPGGARP